MHFVLRLSSPSLDVLPLVAIADAVARAAAAGGDTPFHKPTYKGKFRKLRDWVVDDAREGRLAVTDQDGRPGTFDEVVQRAKNDGTYSEVFELSEEMRQKIADGEPFSDALQDPASTKFDLNATHALCVYTTLKNLNDWASAQGNTFSISRVGWIDERGWIEPSASVVVLINGREAIPVRSIPLIAPSTVSADILVRGFLRTDRTDPLYGLSAYVLSEDGSFGEVLPVQWDDFQTSLHELEEKLTEAEQQGEAGRSASRNAWRKESVKLLPPSVFVWKDEFSEAHARAFRRLSEQEIADLWQHGREYERFLETQIGLPDDDPTAEMMAGCCGDGWREQLSAELRERRSYDDSPPESVRMYVRNYSQDAQGAGLSDVSYSAVLAPFFDRPTIMAGFEHLLPLEASPVPAEQPALSGNGRSGAPTLLSDGEGEQVALPPTTTVQEQSKNSEPKEVLRKRQAFIDAFQSVWPSIERDLRDSSRNGLSEEAKHRKHGFWCVKPALDWADQRGKIEGDRAEAFVRAEGESELSVLVRALLDRK